MKFRRTETGMKDDSCMADAETGATNGPIVSLHPLNVGFNEELRKYGLQSKGSQVDSWKWKSIYLLLHCQAVLRGPSHCAPSVKSVY